MKLLHVTLILLLIAGHCDEYLDVQSVVVHDEQSATSTVSRVINAQLGGVVQQAQLQTSP
jgi:hypothetical protein